MNYYERHLGDYSKDTAHLSMIEHGAYGLLLDRYYSTEAGIPADQAHRVARARTREEKQAVDVVLSEFFQMIDGVWVNKRADEEIEKFQAKQPTVTAKKENDKERQRRARERRKSLIEELRSHSVVMPFSTTTEALQAELSRVTNSERHTTVTQHVTRDNTCTQAPDTRHHIKPTAKAAGFRDADAVTGAAALADPLIARSIELTALLKQRGAELQANDPRVRDWAKKGITDAQVLAALDIAQERRMQKADPRAINAGFIDSILPDVLKTNASKNQRKTVGEIREETIAELTGRGRNERTNERDISGESQRIEA